MKEKLLIALSLLIDLQAATRNTYRVDISNNMVIISGKDIAYEYKIYDENLDQLIETLENLLANNIKPE